MTFESFTTTIPHPFTYEPLSVEVSYRMGDIGHMMIANESVQPIIDSVIGDSREWIAELDMDDLSDLTLKASRHNAMIRGVEETLFRPDYGE